VEKYAKDPTVRIHYIAQDQETCRYCEPGYSPETAKINRENRNRSRNAINKGRYDRAHPFKKAIVGGKYVSIRR
jgi:hypothetical protein